MLRNTGKFIKSKNVDYKSEGDNGDDNDANNQKHRAQLQNQEKQFQRGKDGIFAGRKDTRIQEVNDTIRIDNLYGFFRVNDVKERTGYLINMHSTELVDEDKRLISGVDYYFIEENGDRFKISMIYYPYFYILSRSGHENELSSFLLKKYKGIIIKVEIVAKEDLDLPNHLSGLKQKYLKLSFSNLFDLQKVRKDIKKSVKKNQEYAKSQNYYTELLATNLKNDFNDFEENSDEDNDDGKMKRKKVIDNMDNIMDIREFDIPHHVRVSIDLNIFVGCWYTIKSRGTETPIITHRKDLLETIEPVILAYDIETTKLPLKFPDALVDQIMMISYMIDGKGFLITNREIVGQDINDFEYTPKPEFPGFFKVYNEQCEKSLIKRFFNHIIEVSPSIFVSYNGDFFDWPFVETRAAINGIDMHQFIGFKRNKDNIFTSSSAMHMDCLNWVKRDSYLPVGSQGLKAVTKAKLRYNPIEVDPEKMCKLARDEPEIMANYSVSDAVATYYLYLKYIHPFIFALCTIIPMEPDEVLRKGSGTLCESLLMVQAYQSNIIFPNKKENELNKFTNDGHLLDSETYVGGHVEALESGVFRADIPYHFKIIPSMIDKLIDNIENTLNWTIKEEENVELDLVENLQQVKTQIYEKLINLKEKPNRYENPIIYHLDVGAMYPNIILTNRLQPSAMVNNKDCASCCYNEPNALCKRVMQWTWRGEYLPANMGEYQRIKQQLEMEKFSGMYPTSSKRSFNQLMDKEQADFVKNRLKEFCKKTYKKGKVTKIEVRDQTVCQRENSFYVDTVRAFRDRRYEYKGLTKVAKQQVNAATASGDGAKIKSAKNLEILYDSLQLAHKCILNSFYGYVMRRGSRWFSMEMGGIVCHTGSEIITKAREIVEQIGRPLELDTDGIWCMLPSSFPDNFVIKTNHQKKSKIIISYPNAILNYMVKQEFTNNVYHQLEPVNNENERNEYNIKSENTIFFEVDGPYLAMVLPAAREEGKKLKKRYAVFHFDGTLAELKGFEIKRRGELQLIKIFQSSVFECFLKGKTLTECYAAVAKVANNWLNILFNKGEGISEEELFELISENKSMSRKLEDYGQQKSTSISTAKRLAEFLGDQMVKDAGLACKYIISKKPEGAPVTERAIPVAIFQSKDNIALSYLRKWLKDSSLQSYNLKDILDWDYYIERLGSAIQKIITIPAYNQGISNPVPKVKHPDWLYKKTSEKSTKFQQRKISDIFQIIDKEKPIGGNDNDDDDDDEEMIQDIEDIEDIENGSNRNLSSLAVATVQRKRKISEEKEAEEDENISWRKALGPPPPMGKTKAERQAWLDFHKRKWAYQAKQRGIRHKKRQRMDNNIDDNYYVVGNVRRIVRDSIYQSTIGGFLKRAQRNLLEATWQIIQIGETNEPGIYRLWVFVNQELHQLKLIVPRIFYINSRIERDKPKQNDLWRRCTKVLPRSKQIYYLYEYTIPENFYQENSQSLIEIITQPENEGVYETKTPLIFRAIINLGCVCKVPRNITHKMLDNNDTFHLNQLMIQSSLVKDYLSNDKIKFIYIYHHWSENKKRSMWGLFLNPIKICHIFVQDSVKSDQLPNMENLYKTELNIAIETHHCGLKCANDLNFDKKFEIQMDKVYKGIQDALDNYKKKMMGATILVIQSPINNKELQMNIPILNDFPLVTNNVQDLDNLYSTLEWQKIGAKYMLRHFFRLEINIESMINYSKFFEIPIGNICNDINIFGADISYARYLKQHNFILWCSNNENPDLGGHEKYDTRCLTSLLDDINTTNTIVNKPGVYSNICIELEIESLAINTILQSDNVNNIDGTDSFVAFHNGPQLSLQQKLIGQKSIINNYDEISASSVAFRILKNLARDWMNKVINEKNKIADEQIMYFYRWLTNPNSLLYDPALKKTLNIYIKKLFIQLIVKFQEFDSQIIFANYNKIILSTKKNNLNEAIHHTEYIIHGILNHSLFRSIAINIVNIWKYFMWLNSYNYAGMKDSQEEKDNENENENDNDNDDIPQIVMNWNLSDILPQQMSCKATFESIIVTYISAIYQFIEEINPERQNKNKKTTSISQSVAKQFGLNKEIQDVKEFAKKLISGKITQQLFTKVQLIHAKLPTKTLNIKENPNLDLGINGIKTIKPALELIKAICKVLSLDKEIDNEVYNMKKHMLKLINIGEFSDENKWSDPSISFVLPEVICKCCNHIRNIDLCKDIYQRYENEINVWGCSICGENYDNDEIEFILIDIINRKMMSYVLQDLECKKCHEIQRANMNNLCSCSGQYKLVIPNEHLIKHVKILYSISQKSKMLTLSHIISTFNLLSLTSN